MPTRECKIGLTGLDTSHVIAFTQILNDPRHPHHVAGGQVVAGYPGGSGDLEVSRTRVGDFTRKLRDEFGVRILDTPEAVAEASDLVFITAVDGRVHRDLLARVLPWRKPVFIDKPFATSAADAQAMLDAAGAAGVPVMSCSSLRCGDAFRAALEALRKEGPIAGCDVYGPMDLQPPLPALCWYGVHGIEMAVAALGPGCARVRDVAGAGADLLTLEWTDGRMASLRGMRTGHRAFGAVLHGKSGARHVEPGKGERPDYAAMLELVLAALPEGRSAVPPEEMLDSVRIMEAGNLSRQQGGLAVETGSAP